MAHLTAADYPTKLFLEFSSGDTVDLNRKKIVRRSIPSSYFSNSHFPPSFYCAYDFLVSTESYSCIIIDWFQTKLYTRVIVNITKRMKKHPFWGARFSINFWVQRKLPRYTQHPFINLVGWIFINSKCWWVNLHHHFIEGGFLGYNPKKYISL